MAVFQLKICFFSKYALSKAIFRNQFQKYLVLVLFNDVVRKLLFSEYLQTAGFGLEITTTGDISRDLGNPKGNRAFGHIY